MSKILVLLLACCLSTQAFADIRSNDSKDSAFIKVSSPSEGRYRLELCEGSGKCSRLGDHDLSSSELSSFARNRTISGSVKFVGAAAATAGLAWLGAWIGGIGGGIGGEKLLGTTESSTMGALLIGGIVGIGAGAAGGVAVGYKMSPREDLRVAHAMRSILVDGSDQRVSDVRGLASKLDGQFRSSLSSESSSGSASAQAK